MNDPAFDRSVDLIRLIGALDVPGGESVRDVLRLGGSVSLWDAVAPTLALYRFPRLCSERPLRRRERLARAVWPYRGMAGRLRDRLLRRRTMDDTQCSRWPQDNAVVLFPAFWPLFFRDVLEPVADLVGSSGHATSVALGNEGQHSVWRHWDAEVQAHYDLLRRRLAHIAGRFFGSWDVPRLAHGAAAERGIRIDAALIRGELRWLFWRELPRLLPQAAVAEHIFHRHRVDMIVTADDADPRCRLYSLRGRSRQIPVLLVQQGIGNVKAVEWRFFSADAVAAMGETSRAMLENHGVPAERITLTGHPGFDRLVQRQPAKSSAPRGMTLLFTSQPFYVGAFQSEESRREMIRAIFRAAGAAGNIRVVVKPHPSDDERELRELARGFDHVEFVDRTIDVADLIAGCDVLATFFSNTALQALIDNCGSATISRSGILRNSSVAYRARSSFSSSC